MKVKITLTLPTDTVAKIKRLVAAQRISAGQFFETFLEAMIAKQEKDIASKKVSKAKPQYK